MVTEPGFADPAGAARSLKLDGASLRNGMSRREQIKMDDAEVAAFLKGERTVTCATVGLRGWPHLMPLWYVPRETPAGEPGPRIWAWTYGVSQKVRNLERDPRATLLLEAAEEYQELRGVMIECEAVVHRELELVTELGAEILLRNSVPRGVEPPAELPREAREVVAKQAVKRVGLEFVERRRTSWDHRKLGGLY
jgi:nitroimidazol reductase NimA-like FMN-containing flavoprotein (pyridoxamine 5'-phosphate oxidase superfamily)